MKLPYGDKAIIEQRKIMDYSLSPDHDDGKHKARLFRDLLGLTRDHVTLLLNALKEAAADGEAVSGRLDHYGRKYSANPSPPSEKQALSSQSCYKVVHGKHPTPGEVDLRACPRARG